MAYKGTKIHLKGMDTVLRNLDREIKKIKNATLAGLIKAQIKIRRDMDLIPPKIPVDIGNLRSSYFTVTSKDVIAEGKSAVFKGKNAGKLFEGHHSVMNVYKLKATASKRPGLIMGFSAYYASLVHEWVGGGKGGPNWKRPGAGPKFMEAHIKNNKDAILKAIRGEAKIR